MSKADKPKGPTEAEITREVNDAARYILQMQSRKKFRSGEDCFYDRESLLAKLDSMFTQVDTVYKQTMEMVKLFAQGELNAFLEIERQVVNANSSLSEAWAQLKRANEEFRDFHPAGTKALNAQHSAARLAHAIVGKSAPRRTAEVARRIMVKLDIQCSKEALTIWIREAREEDKKRAKGIWPT